MIGEWEYKCAQGQLSSLDSSSSVGILRDVLGFVYKILCDSFQILYDFFGVFEIFGIPQDSLGLTGILRDFYKFLQVL